MEVRRSLSQHVTKREGLLCREPADISRITRTNEMWSTALRFYCITHWDSLILILDQLEIMAKYILVFAPQPPTNLFLKSHSILKAVDQKVRFKLSFPPLVERV